MRTGRTVAPGNAPLFDSITEAAEVAMDNGFADAYTATKERLQTKAEDIIQQGEHGIKEPELDADEEVGFAPSAAAASEPPPPGGASVPFAEPLGTAMGNVPRFVQELPDDVAAEQRTNETGGLNLLETVS